jgi:hypothetical protein
MRKSGATDLLLLDTDEFGSHPEKKPKVGRFSRFKQKTSGDIRDPKSGDALN